MKSREELRAEIRAFEDEWSGLPSRDSANERRENLQTAIDKRKAELAERERTIADIERRGRDERYLESERPAPERPSLRYQGGRAADEARGEAFRALEARGDQLGSTHGDRLWKLIERDAAGIDSRYIAAVADPHYESAFAKQLLEAGQPGARSMLTEPEIAAVQRVGEVLTERALAEGEGATGGYAVPFALDPTIILTNDGVINPLRTVATVTTISTRTWKGVSSEGVTAAFAKEGAEVADGSPTLGQPEIKTERAHAFVPYSIEVGEDWGTMSGELGRLFSEAKNVLEAEKFATGTGTNEPSGIVTGATEAVESATEKVFAVGDLYTVQQALPPRYQPRARWLATNTVANVIYRFVAQADSEEPKVMTEARDSILGKPFNELSTMTSTVNESGEKPIVYGDVATGFRIVDRIGMRVELIPHLFGENGRPTGERGLYAIWRTGSKVVNPNALRVLKLK